MIESERFLDYKALAARLGLSRSAIFKLMNDGLLPNYRFGRARRVSEADFQAFLVASRVSHGDTA